MMGSSIPFRSHWPKVLVDSSGRIVGQQQDGGISISRKPTYRGRIPLHPPRHHCFKEKYFPHGSQAFQSLLAQYQARTMMQPGLECVGIHISAPSEQQALEQLTRGATLADQPQGAQAESRGGQGTSAAQAPDSAEAGQEETQAAGGPSQGGMPIGPTTCPQFQQKCPCELITQVCCPCKELMQHELARLAAMCAESSPEQTMDSVGTSPIKMTENLEASPSQQEVSTSPDEPRVLEMPPITPIENLVTSPEPPEDLETSPEPLETSPSQQVEDLETSPEAPENLETSPEPLENLEMSPEPVENLETSPTVQAEDLETSPEAVENLDLLPNEPAENLETASPQPMENMELSPEPTESVEPSPEQAENLEPLPEQAENLEPLPEQAENLEPSPEQAENLEPSPEQAENLEPSPEQAENLEPSPEQAENLEPSPEPSAENPETAPEEPEN